MTASTISNMKVYDDLMYGGFVEKLSQNLNAFNGASNGALVLLSEFSKGDYTKESFFQLISGTIRRDDTSLADADDTPINMDENIAVKLKSAFGPFAVTNDSFRSQGIDIETFSFMQGQAMADDLVSYMLNRAILSVTTALSGIAALNTNVSGAGAGNLLNHSNMNASLAKLGDRSSKVIAWVMSGAAFHALVGNAIVDMKFNDSGVAIYNGGVPTLGRPVLVTDSPALTTGSDTYQVLGLQKGAVIVNQSETPEAKVADITGKKNLMTRFQGEAAFSLQVKGFKWNTTGGGRNPNDAAISTSSNWVQNVSSVKDAAGVQLITSQA